MRRRKNRHNPQEVLLRIGPKTQKALCALSGLKENSRETEDMGPANCGPSNPSGPTVAYGDLISFYNHRYFPDSTGMLEHLLESARFCLNINKLCVITVCRPGILRIRSTHLAIDDSLHAHKYLLLTVNSSGETISDFEVYDKIKE